MKMHVQPKSCISIKGRSVLKIFRAAVPKYVPMGMGYPKTLFSVSFQHEFNDMVLPTGTYAFLIKKCGVFIFRFNDPDNKILKRNFYFSSLFWIFLRFFRFCHKKITNRLNFFCKKYPNTQFQPAAHQEGRSKYTPGEPIGLGRGKTLLHEKGPRPLINRHITD